MKMNIQITKTGTGLFKTEEKIVDIDICNGNWKYWDSYMETTEKISLTINSINKSYYLSRPVKDTYTFYDHELYKETHVLKVKEATVRNYDSLLEFLNHRIENVKEDYKKGTYKLLDYDKKGGRKFTAVLFDEQFNKNNRDDAVSDLVYEQDGLIEVKIEVVE